MSQIFLSYASADRDRVKRIAEAMQRHGYRVWWDRHIAPGQVFDEVIERALNDSACVVVLWSHASVASQWVKTEAAEAASRRILVPARIDDVKIPLEFRRLQAADLTQWNGDPQQPEFQQFLRAVDRELDEFSDRVAEAPTMLGSAAEATPSGFASAVTPMRDARTSPPGSPAAAEANAPAAPAAVRRRSPAPMLAGLASLLLVVAAIAWFSRQSDPQTPDVVGLPYEQARAALAAVGLAAERHEQASDSGAPGVVLEQRPAAGSELPRGSSVAVTIAIAAVPVAKVPDVENAASNAALEPPAVEPTVAIPDLRGQTPERAAAMLAEVGLTIDAATEVAANDVVLGTIVGHEPPASETVSRGSSVQIAVATRRSVPDLGGLSLQQAQQALTKLGLEPRVERIRAGRGDTDDRVVGQMPAPGTDITAVGAVTVTVAIATPKKVSGGEGLFRTNGSRCAQVCKDIGLRWTSEWSGGANSCTCDF